MSTVIEPGFTTGQTIGTALITLAIWEGGKVLFRFGRRVKQVFGNKKKLTEKPAWWNLPNRDLTEEQYELRKAHIAGLVGRDRLTISPTQREEEELEILKQNLFIARTRYRDAEAYFKAEPVEWRQNARDTTLAALNKAQEAITAWYNEHEQEIPF